MTVILEGGAIALAGVIVGRLLPGRRRKKIKQPQPICGCTHHYSMHDPKTKACGASVKVAQHSGGQFTSYKLMACACLQYTGPEPLPSIMSY